MNYIIEDDIDFFKELNTICGECSTNQNTDNVCLIDNTKLEINEYIELFVNNKIVFV